MAAGVIYTKENIWNIAKMSRNNERKRQVI